MLILAGVTIETAISGGIFNYAIKANLKAEVASLKEKLNEKQIITDNEIKNGTITDCVSKSEIQMKAQDKNFITLLNTEFTEEVWIEKK